MSTNEKEPRSVMSRGKGDGQVVNGARMIKYRRFLSPHRGTWPVNPDDDANSDPDPPPPSKRQKTKRERVARGGEKALKPETVARRQTGHLPMGLPSATRVAATIAAAAGASSCASTC